MDWVNHVMKINNKFKFQLFGRNYTNLQKCYNNISVYDEDGNGYMSPHTFNLFLNSFGVFYSTQEINIVKDKFNKEGLGIDYVAFLENVRNDISPKRLATVDHCFQELAQGDYVKISTLLQRFDANNHPHHRCRVKDSKILYQEFQEAIKKRSADSVHLNYNEFKEYYLDLNACVPQQRQQYFVDILINGYRLLDNRVTIDRLRQMQITIFEKVRQKTYFKKDQGLRSKADFRFFDMEDKGVVDYQRFSQALQRLACKFTPKEMKALYSKHAGSDGILTYEQMCGLFFEMGSGVKDNVNPIYEISKKTGNFSVTHGMTKKLQ